MPCLSLDNLPTNNISKLTKITNYKLYISPLQFYDKIII